MQLRKKKRHEKMIQNICIANWRQPQWYSNIFNWTFNLKSPRLDRTNFQVKPVETCKSNRKS